MLSNLIAASKKFITLPMRLVTHYPLAPITIFNKVVNINKSPEIKEDKLVKPILTNKIFAIQKRNFFIPPVIPPIMPSSDGYGDGDAKYFIKFLISIPTVTFTAYLVMRLFNFDESIQGFLLFLTSISLGILAVITVVAYNLHILLAALILIVLLPLVLFRDYQQRQRLNAINKEKEELANMSIEDLVARSLKSYYDKGDSF